MTSTFTPEQITKLRNALTSCTMCGFCKSVCPSFKAINWDTDLSRGRIVLTYGLATGQLQPDESVVKSMGTCTTCADCVRRCTSKVDIVEIVEMCRSDLVANGYILLKHKAMCEGIVANNNPFGEKVSAIEKLGLKPHKAEIGYFAGCTATYRATKTSKAVIKILDALGSDWTGVDEVCCGSVMGRVGWNTEDQYVLMRKNVDRIASLGIKTLVLSCAGCYRMFKKEYPKHIDVPFEVLHISEYLAKQDLKLSSLGDVTVTYHDPCHLGRHCGVYDAPREVIAKFPGIDFREMKFNRQFSHCCGGGGGVRSGYPEEAADIAKTRMGEADFADVVITSCPFCVTNLSDQAGGKRVVDLVELVAEHIQ